MQLQSFFRRRCLLVLLPVFAQAQHTVTTTGGTVNVVPKYSGTATLVNSAIFESGGKVGIGTTAPAVTLTVNGGFTASGKTIVANAFRFYTGSLDGNHSYVDFRANTTSGNAVISAKSGTLFLNLDHGTGGVSFGNGAASVVGSISAAGNAVFSGTGNSSFAGNLGIGTTTPSSRLTVAGLIQSTSGGFKFPDGTILTTAPPTGLTSVSHNGTLTGLGTSGSPLSVSAPLSLSSDGGTASTLNLTATGLIGTALYAVGGPQAFAISIYGGDANDLNGGGTAGYFRGGEDDSASGGYGVQAYGGNGVQGGYGIYAEGGGNGDGTSNYAGFFNGDVAVQGNLSKSGGSFKIDHPTDPANKFLYHSFVESPDMKNIYDGTVTTDAHGLATVTLPEWFAALNRDFRYQLTVIGQFAQAIVASEIAGNEFTIRTDKANVKVSWQVTGIRQDAWANAHRIPVEEEKSEKVRGHYLHPELYDQPAEKSVDWAEHPHAMRKVVERRIPK